MKKRTGIIFSIVLLLTFILTPLQSISAARDNEITGIDTENLDNFTGVLNESEVDKNNSRIIQLDQALEKMKNLERKSLDVAVPTSIPSLDEETSLIGVKKYEEVFEPDINLRASYEVQVYTDSSRYYWVNGLPEAAAQKECTIYKYTDGKVHLYKRTIYVEGYDTYKASYPSYGKIVNTDGSFSSTQDDKVIFTNGSARKDYAYDFYMNQTSCNFQFNELILTR